MVGAGSPSVCRSQYFIAIPSRAPTSPQPTLRMGAKERHERCPSTFFPPHLYVYARETLAEATTANVLTRDEARRIASNIAKLPKLLGKQ
jgi:hypothetical protein